MRPLRAKKSLLSLLPHAKAAKTAEFQCKLRCRWSSRWLRATENAEAKRNEDDDDDDDDNEDEDEDDNENEDDNDNENDNEDEYTKL